MLSKKVDSPDTNSSPTLAQLQLEMVKMKSQLENDILSEQVRANEAEAKASMIARAEEQRVADLGKTMHFCRFQCYGFDFLDLLVISPKNYIPKTFVKIPRPNTRYKKGC